jgi:predicted SAM-dependent methyltransferase
MLQVNVGCGEFRAEGWLNLDIYSGEEGQPKPDIIASADSMPFADGVVDRLYAGHVLEHIELDHIPYVLKEFRRVLKEDGGLLIVGPDLTRAEESYPEMIPDIRDGGHRWPGDAHLWESREATMVEILQREGWDTAVADIAPVFLSGKWPVTAGVGWQFAIFATKLPPETE